MRSWYSIEGKDCDVALSTKITLLRNIKGFPFPNRMNNEQRDQVIRLIIDALTAGDDFCNKFEIIDFEKLPAFTASALMERGLISQKFLDEPMNKKLILSKDERVSIMLCGEDHIRVTVLFAGLELEEAFNHAGEIDGLICGALPIAFDDRLGFLTESPMDLGTALRAEVLLQLCGIEEVGEIRGIADSVSRIGLSVKEITTPEGENKASFYRLTNLITVGITERSAIENLNSIAGQVISREREARASIDRINIEDSVFRALALLKNARKMDLEEAAELISKFKLGVSTGVISGIPQHIPYEMLIQSGDGMLMSDYGEMQPKDIAYTRAEHIRKLLNSIDI